MRTLQIDYQRPARFNDLLEVHSHVADTRGASLVFAQTIQRRDDAEPLCHAQVKVACIDAQTFRARRLPRPLLREIVGEG